MSKMFFGKHVLRQLICVMPLNNVVFMLGYGAGWVPQVLSWLRLQITLEECSWIGSSYFLGRGLSPMIVAYLVDAVGRKALIVAAAVFCFLPWLALLYFEASAVAVQYAARIVLGVGCALIDVVISIYIGENCSSTLRGVFNSLNVAYYLLGTMTVFILGTYCSYATLNLVGAALAGVTLVSTYALREPADYLLTKGRHEEARRNFFWLRGAGCDPDSNEDELHAATEKEFAELREYVEALRDTDRGWRAFGRIFSADNRSSLKIVVVGSTLFWMNGFAPISSYLTILLKDATFASPRELSILYGVAMTVFTCAAMFIIDKFNRRTLLLASLSLLIAVEISLSLAFTFASSVVDSQKMVILKFVLLSLHAGIYVSVPFPLVSALRGEILPQNVKAVATGLILSVASFASFSLTQIFWPISKTFEMRYNFYLYAASGIAAFVFVYLKVPETRGKTLARIQDEMSRR